MKAKVLDICAPLPGLRVSAYVVKMARWRCVCPGVLIRHNVTPPEVIIPAALPFGLLLRFVNLVFTLAVPTVYRQTIACSKREGRIMALHSTRWLALPVISPTSLVTIFLPFWSVWLKGLGLTPETIGLLLGVESGRAFSR